MSTTEPAAATDPPPSDSNADEHGEPDDDVRAAFGEPPVPVEHEPE